MHASIQRGHKFSNHFDMKKLSTVVLASPAPMQENYSPSCTVTRLSYFVIYFLLFIPSFNWFYKNESRVNLKLLFQIAFMNSKLKISKNQHYQIFLPTLLSTFLSNIRFNKLFIIFVFRLIMT